MTKKRAARKGVARKASSVRKNVPARPRASRSRKTAGPRAAAARAAVTAPPQGDADAVVAALPPAEAQIVAPARRLMPWRALAAFFAFALAMSALGGFIVNTVDAATFQGPSQAPPGGNIPITIWNRVASTARQGSAAIEIDGGGPGPTTATGLAVGSNTLDLGSAAGGQNVVYGVADYAGMNATDYLMKFQTAAPGPAYTTRFSVDKNGAAYAYQSVTSTQLIANMGLNVAGYATFGSATDVLAGVQSLILGNIDIGSAAGTSFIQMQNESVDRFRVDIQGRIMTGSADTVVAGAQNLVYGNMDTTSTGNLLLLQNESSDRFKVTAKGDVKAAGCFGKTFAGLTASVWPGNVGSYYAADNKCGTDFPGSHVCRVEELLESVQCSIAGDPIRTSGGNFAWVNGGPPGDSAVNANDCIGWTSNGASSYGRVWIFDNTTGGRGTLTGCNVGGGGLKFACCR